jgi:hypothetical protein
LQRAVMMGTGLQAEAARLERVEPPEAVEAAARKHRR